MVLRLVVVMAAFAAAAAARLEAAVDDDVVDDEAAGGRRRERVEASVGMGAERAAERDEVRVATERFEDMARRRRAASIGLDWIGLMDGMRR